MGDSAAPRRTAIPSPRMISQFRNDEYTVGWICALQEEFVVAISMLSQRHGRPQSIPEHDDNSYVLGEIATETGEHKVVISCLPAGIMGTSSAAVVAGGMLRTFTSLRFGLLVGIGGAVPNPMSGRDIRLGDVVVSIPQGPFGGVVQYDFGKTKTGESFEHRGQLNSPPAKLLSYVTLLQTSQSELLQERNHVYEALECLEKRSEKYHYPDLEDRLFRATCLHNDDQNRDDVCGGCDHTQLLPRRNRQNRSPVIHLGIIGSGNMVVADALERDRIAGEYNNLILCLEMEAAGLMNNFPCLVIRGISDYADSHKNDHWRSRAIASASAYAKALLYLVPSAEVLGLPEVAKAMELLQKVEQSISNMQGKLTNGFASFQQDKEEQERHEILNWLTSIDYGPRQSDNIKRRHDGTGLWFFSSPEYQTWVQKKGQTLFCPGIPGSRKTTLMATVINDLFARFSPDENVGIAYVYCDFKRQNDQSLEHILSSLLKQLLQQRSHLPSDIQTLYSNHKNRKTRPSHSELIKSLQLTISSYPTNFILIDALDECQTTDGCRKKLLSSLFDLQKRSNVNIFATSRENDEIGGIFEGCASLKIGANDDDIKAYLNEEMKRLRPEIASNEISDMIQSAMIEVCGGMFLLAVLHMNTLIDLPTRGDVKEALQNLSQGLEGLDPTYRLAMERIENQGPRSRGFAKQILAWIIYSRRELTTIELQHALAIQIGQRNIDKDFIPGVDVLKSVCAGLVTIDEESKVIHLVHYSALEFFTRTRDEWFPDAEVHIAKACLTYLSFDAFQLGPCHSHRAFEERQRLYPFYYYASTNWGHHARESAVGGNFVLDFLRNKTMVTACCQVMNMSEDLPELFVEGFLKVTGFHLVAYFNLKDYANQLLQEEDDIDSVDHYGLSPLSWAAELGHLQIAEFLLDKGATINLTDYTDNTPLSWAAMNGHVEIISFLIKEGAMIDIPNQKGLTPLSCAAVCGQAPAASMLIDRGAIINTLDEAHRTPLSWAASHGDDTTVKLLLDKGATVDLADENYWTPLLWAVLGDHAGVVDLLLDHGANVDLPDENGFTPILRAAKNDLEDIIRRLLESGPSLDVVDKDGLTALAWASRLGKERVVEMLTERGAMVDILDHEGRSPLSWAAKNGHERVVGILAPISKAITIPDITGRTPLDWALEHDHQAIVEQLIFSMTHSQ